MEAYTIGIKRRFFGYRHYLVTEHKTETRIPARPQAEGDSNIKNITPRLVLKLADGRVKVFSNIENRDWFIGAGMEAYTIGIKRRFFGYRHYLVTEHKTETRIPAWPQAEGDSNIKNITPRLVLKLADGRVKVFSNIENRDWFIGADYEEVDNGIQSADG